ncbi:MAG: AmmeMemoRadiSam system protein B [Candidatus Omnitrophica bacterium]|nr:AmmeMemoRadiSam system protein B [Candidatus Omnitrophota bacterium]
MFKNIFLSIIIFLSLSFNQASYGSVKEADLAGSWYPANRDALSAQIKNYLEKAEISPVEGRVIALICPHAGINYSGQTAAYGFKAVKDNKIETAILVGFSHRMTYDGIAVFDEDGYKTPLGILYTDKNLVKEITSFNKKIYPYPEAFFGENSVELILPFIQVALDNPKILLLAIGNQSFENSEITADAIASLLKEKKNYIIIASTDMSHYLPRYLAEKTDQATARAIETMNPGKLYSECTGENRMCGVAPVVATMIAAKKLGADKAEILKLSSSSRTGAKHEEVVGYLSAAFVESEGLLNDKQKKRLLKLARDTISLYLTKGERLEAQVDDPGLKEVMGVFVTLHKGHELRGCIGNIIGRQPLYSGVIDMAIAAATQDPRFPPLTEDEFGEVTIEISVLSPLKKITDPDEIIPGTHGVLVKKGFRSGVYLPQVATETGWNREQFMNSLCAHKAGIDASAWKKGECEINIFTAEVFGE